MKDDLQIHFWAHMLDECFNKEQFLCEDREGKNINKAEKWIKDNHPEVIGQKLENGTTITPRILTQEIRNTMPNVRMADCKFLVGATRMYFDLMNDGREFQPKMNKLNKMLKIICMAHADEYDNNFNGLSFDELDKKFSGAVKKELDDDREQISKLQLIKNAAYKIIPIDSFDEASKYGKYTSWCVTHYPDMYNNYTKGGLGRFYFCLLDGFENVPKVEGEGCPMDTYGKSMIAISVNDDGSLNTCTCRWNHDNGANDNMMDTKQISEFFGVDFYKTFKPYDTDALWKKILVMQIPLHDLNDNYAKFCKTFDCVAVYANDDEDEDDYSVVFKKLVDDKIVELPYIDAKTAIIDGKFMTIKNGRFIENIPTKIDKMPKNIKGDFVIPNSVKNIGNWAFTGCRGLTRVTIPDSVTSIGDCAFEDCSDLTYVTISNGVKSIGGGVFYCCINLESVTIPDSVISIGNDAFRDCDKLNSLVFKGKTIEEVKAMENYPFGIKDESIITCEDSLNENKATYLQKYRDESDVKSIVDMFWAIRNRLSAPQNDIDWWIKKPFDDLRKFVQNYSPSNKKQRRDADYKQQAIENNAKLIGVADGYEIWYVPTYDAMRILGRFYKGRSAKWCVASDDPDFWFDNYEDSEFVVLVREHPKNDEFDKVAIEMMNHGRYYNEDDIIPWDLENNDFTFDRGVIDNSEELVHYAWTLFKENGETREQYFG